MSTADSVMEGTIDALPEILRSGRRWPETTSSAPRMMVGLRALVMTDDFASALERYHAALRAFARGDASVIKKDFSQADDIVLANPFGPAAVGWAAASEWMDFASSRFRDGDVPQFEELTRQSSGDLVVLHETEHWQARVGDGSKVEGP